MPYLYQFIQRNHRSIFGLQLNGSRFKFHFFFSRCTYQSDPLSALRTFFNRTDPQKLFFIMAVNGPLHSLQCDSQTRKLVTVILQLPLHRCSSIQFHFINPLQLSQYRLDILFRILLNQNRIGRRIQCISNKRSGCLIIRTSRTDLRITHPLGQLRPGLSDDGRHFKAGNVNIRMLVQFQRN
jgi:hypothetical protein